MQPVIVEEASTDMILSFAPHEPNFSAATPAVRFGISLSSCASAPRRRPEVPVLRAPHQTLDNPVGIQHGAVVTIMEGQAYRSLDGWTMTRESRQPLVVT